MTHRPLSWTFTAATENASALDPEDGLVEVVGPFEHEHQAVDGARVWMDAHPGSRASIFGWDAEGRNVQSGPDLLPPQ